MFLPYEDGGGLILKALEKREEKKAWDMWISYLPHWEEFIPFSEFYESMKPRQISQRSREDILKEAEEITMRIKGR